MSRLALALLAALLLIPAATGQMSVRPSFVESGERLDGRPISVELRVDTATKDLAPFVNPWLVAGYDNLVNLTLRNNLDAPLNATFTLNVTGATAGSGSMRLQAGPYGYVGERIVVHPSEAGLVEIVAEATDAFQQDGSPLKVSLTIPALALPSMRFIDPPVVERDDAEFQQTDPFRGSREGLRAHARLRPGESITPRIELTNPFEHAIAGFQLRLPIPGQELPPLTIPPLDAGATHVAEFQEYQPVQGEFGFGRFAGPMGSFELRPVAQVSVGGATLSAGAVEYGIERGAIIGVDPTWAVVDVQDGLAVDLFVPRAPVLGAPTRLKYNLTNLQTSPLQGGLTITLSTPNGLFYEVQGPETRLIAISLRPGEVVSGAIEFTPRVTGTWGVNTIYRSAEGFGFGGGSGFDVAGPVVIAFDQNEQVFARIGEPVAIGLAVASVQPLQDAQLRVTTGSNYYRGVERPSSSEYTPGLASRLVESRTPTQTLGNLRPGAPLNASIELVGRSSGQFNVVPYVLAEGFAYTSTIPREPATKAAIDVGISYNSGTTLNFAVQPRTVPPGLSLAPFTLGLAFFVGAWTLRTRFVK